METRFEKAFAMGDERHEIIDDVSLAKNGKLHRFKNEGGADCSAIYVGGEEAWWHYRSEEERMIKAWNDDAIADGWTLKWCPPEADEQETH